MAVRERLVNEARDLTVPTATGIALEPDGADSFGVDGNLMHAQRSVDCIEVALENVQMLCMRSRGTREVVFVSAEKLLMLLFSRPHLAGDVLSLSRQPI